MSTVQQSADPSDTAHLHAGDRITMEEIVTQLSAAAVWLRQLAVAAERPVVPVELGKLCDELDQMASRLDSNAEALAEVDVIITEDRPLMPTFAGVEPWGAAAHGADPDKTKFGKQLSTVLSPWQIRALARDDMPWRAEQAVELTSYRAGLEGLPGLDRWESPRAVRRRAEQRERRIRQQSRQEPCTSCGTAPGSQCRTKTGRLADVDHQARRRAAIAAIDQEVPGDRA